ncbi:MAG TPA: hypothetical protein VGI95_00205 [Caulobacteraceae bacterium]|jgi:hypothetical protein
MRGLGRLLALPWMLVALALQGLAPAQALAMPRDVFGSPICSGHDLGGGHKPVPGHGQDHDCCAGACTLMGLAASPPPPFEVGRSAVSSSIVLEPGGGDCAAPAISDRPPNARAPPLASLTT